VLDGSLDKLPAQQGPSLGDVHKEELLVFLKADALFLQQVKDEAVRFSH